MAVCVRDVVVPGVPAGAKRLMRGRTTLRRGRMPGNERPCPCRPNVRALYYSLIFHSGATAGGDVRHRAADLWPPRNCCCTGPAHGRYPGYPCRMHVQRGRRCCRLALCVNRALFRDRACACTLHLPGGLGRRGLSVLRCPGSWTLGGRVRTGGRPAVYAGGTWRLIAGAIGKCGLRGGRRIGIGRRLGALEPHLPIPGQAAGPYLRRDHCAAGICCVGWTCRCCASRALPSRGRRWTGHGKVGVSLLRPDCRGHTGLPLASMLAHIDWGPLPASASGRCLLRA